MNGWINLYKPRGISSAKAVAIVKRSFPKRKIGHTGTLDLEAEGVLPIAIGEATKLVSVLIDAQKIYSFTVQFGAKTDTADSSGRIIEECDKIPSKQECENIVSQFIGEVKQIPPAYSALKVNGQRAYKLAREKNQHVELPSRLIHIFDLKCTDYDPIKARASFCCTCSKGTYIRTLAEDISLSLQSLGYVVELRRLGVGTFNYQNSVNVDDVLNLAEEERLNFLLKSCLKIESVLDDIPVLEASEDQVRKIKLGQQVYFEVEVDCEQDFKLVCIKDANANLIAIGTLRETLGESLNSKNFKSSRVFNL